jgi:hypothetical protein
MTIDELADILKRRACEAVCYFHTDHFEPWPYGIDASSARAVKRMAAQSSSSPHARRLSLFYSVFVPYDLAGATPGAHGAEERAPGDTVIFLVPSPEEADLASEVIRPLIGADKHEMHLHVHHEWWTRNRSHLDSDVSRWVNAHSTAELDDARLELFFRLAKQTIAREIGAPFERWAFIHGNWALNASDPLICHVSNELAMLMRHGGFGDFTFPAGRSYCDPELRTPFTCLPIDLPRAYDDARADPRPIGDGTGVMRSDRFFIWNAPIRSVDVSLDYFWEPERFATPERIVATWLRNSVSLGGRLFVKTHAHSMNAQYRLWEPDGLIPHRYPDIIKVFECLTRVCDRAGVDLHYQTVNEVVGFLAEHDGGERHTVQQASREMPTSSKATLQAQLSPATPRAVSLELLEMHRAWMQTPSVVVPDDDLYAAKVARSTPLESYEMALADEIASRYSPKGTRVIEIGSGWGGLAILLARRGFEVLGFEGNASRHAACRWHFAEQIKRYAGLARLLPTPCDGLFPEAFSDSALAKDKLTLCIATNITHSYSAAHQDEIARTAAACGEFIVDLGRFGVNRNLQSERDDLRRRLTDLAFRPIEQLVFEEPYEYWRFRSRTATKAAR